MTRDLSIKDVAERLGMSTTFIRRHLHQFPGSYLVGGRWRIPQESVENFRAERRKATPVSTKANSA